MLNVWRQVHNLLFFVVESGAAPSAGPRERGHRQHAPAANRTRQGGGGWAIFARCAFVPRAMGRCKHLPDRVLHGRRGVRVRARRQQPRDLWPRAGLSLRAHLHRTCSEMHAVIAVIEHARMDIRQARPAFGGHASVMHTVISRWSTS